MKTDIETLRREFEAACQQVPLDWYCNNGERRYMSEVTHAMFVAFCAGRQASRAEIEQPPRRVEQEIERLQSVIYDYRRMMNDFLSHLEVEAVANIDEIDKPIDSDLQQTVSNNYALRMAEACAIRDKLQSIVDRLPKFADGSPALSGAEAYHPDVPAWVGRVEHESDGFSYAAFIDEVCRPLSECYPTREAMEKANV